MMAFMKKTTITGSEAESKPNNIDNEDSAQPSSSTLEYTIDRMANSTNDGGSGGLCPDSRHYHSFRSVPFIMLPIYSCSGCGERLQSYVVGGSLSSSRAAVQCIACGIYAHRHCAFSKHIAWETKCAAASANYDDEHTTFEDIGMVCEKVEGAPSEHIKDEIIEDSIGPIQTMVTDYDRPNELLETNESNAMSAEPPPKNKIVATQQGPLLSIFRSESIESLNRRNLPAINASASVDQAFTSEKTPNNVQNTRANFPFLSSASLLPSRNTTTSTKNTVPMIQRCQTWNGVVQIITPNFLEDQDDASKEEIASEPETKKSEDDKADAIDPNTNQNTADAESATTAPIHFATHGFQVVSQALQENIIMNFNRLIPKQRPDEQIDNPESQDDGSTISDFKKDDSLSLDGVESEERERSTNEIVGDEKDDLQARSLLETSEPKKDSSMDRKRIGLATIAGTIVGGVVGVGLAGPVGGVIGIKCGQTAGMLGVLLEGSVTASVLASGIGVGIAAGQHIEEKHEARVLALGEGTKQRALLMVRPTIQAPEPIWDDLYQQAIRSYSGSNTGIVNMLIPNETRAAKRERYEREVDIIETGEDELAIADKVLLLASRILSNKESLPGHVYRKLIEAFRCRCRESNIQNLQIHEQKEQMVDSLSVGSSSSKNYSASSIDEDEAQNEDNLLSRTHQRRRDAHAVIKYVTTSLLLTRPGFGHSSSLTEKTATAVESLVFGEIYDLVIEEIDMEYQNQDDLLLDKIANFERRQGQKEYSVKTSEDPRFGYKSCISETALGALQCLPQAHSAVDKLRYCVVFLEQISQSFSKSNVKSAMGADSLLKMVCQHILLAKAIGINSQIAFLEEFARDEQLLRGREGYALVTLQASLHFLNASDDFENDIFNDDED
jgi:hypothetical protein